MGPSLSSREARIDAISSPLLRERSGGALPRRREQLGGPVEGEESAERKDSNGRAQFFGRRFSIANEKRLLGSASSVLPLLRAPGAQSRGTDLARRVSPSGAARACQMSRGRRERNWLRESGFALSLLFLSPLLLSYFSVSSLLPFPLVLLLPLLLLRLNGSSSSAPTAPNHPHVLLLAEQRPQRRRASRDVSVGPHRRGEPPRLLLLPQEEIPRAAPVVVVVVPPAPSVSAAVAVSSSSSSPQGQK